MILKEITSKILNAGFEVHKELGAGFLEAVYEEALSHEFRLQSLNFERQKPLDVFYKGVKVKQYIVDFLVEDSVIVELKAIRTYTNVDMAQVLNYLKASNYQVGLLLNFGAASLQYKRLVNTENNIKNKSV